MMASDTLTCWCSAVVAVGDGKHGAYEKVPSMPAAAGGRRLMLLVHARARDTDLNKAVRRLRIRGMHELLVLR